MNDSLLRSFCESTHRKLIVVIGTTLFGLVVLFPLVDDYFDKERDRSTLTDDLGRARQTEAGLAESEKQVAEILAQLEAIDSRAVSSESVSAYRSKIVELVRRSGCQVRRFDVSAPLRRPWLKLDDPLETKTPPNAKQRKTPFTLERRNVVLLVDGSMQSLQDLLGELYNDDTFAHLQRAALQAANRGGDQVTMEIEMWLFALDRRKA